MSEEALTASPGGLMAHARTQPVWSDLSVMVLSRAGAESPKLAALLARIGNASVLERPVRITTFLSQVRSILRGRARQYEVRDRLVELAAAAQERRTLLESERAARAEAERVSRMKDEFLATLSHELRTPLNAILGWSQILTLRNRGDEELAQGLRTIDRNARAQTRIIADLLDMSGIISGKVHLEFQRVSLASVVQAAVDTIRPAADAKQISLHATPAPGAGGMLNGDPNRLQQVFWNLLINAVKFTPEHGDLRFGVAIRGRWGTAIEVRITDTGEGISPEFLPKMFDRFLQADSSTTRHHGGLGLGLAIVRQLVQAHGGRVWAESAGPRQGSTFTVAFPLMTGAEVAPGVVRDAHATRAPARVTNRIVDMASVTILVVDDEADSRVLIKRLLEDCRAVVLTAASAAQAIEVLRAARPQVLISDIGMPGEDGYSLIRRVREMPADCGGLTKAIALTAYARPEDRLNAVSAGFHHHLAKPIEPAELLSVVAGMARSPATLLTSTS